MPKILIVGGGYAGFYTAWKLEKHLRKGEAEVTIVDPRPYMTYLPFLPEVAAGSIEPRHAVVSPRRHLKSTKVINAKVSYVNHAEKTATITPEVGDSYELEYDQVVVTAGSVTRTFPIPGLADEGFGLKSIEEATAIRDRLLDNFAKAANLPAGPERDRLLTFVVVGGGFAGIEVFAELRSFATSLLKYYPQIEFDDISFHLVEAMGRIMPEVSLKTSHWVLKNLANRGALVHLDTQFASCVDGKIELSTGETFESDLIVWTAGVMANPEVVKNTDLPIEERGRVVTRADLRVGTDEEPVEGAWAAGDVSRVPDLTGGGVGGYCVPNAQHAVRQGKLLAKNLIAVIRGEQPRDYVHKNLGAVAGLGVGTGVFQSGKIAVTGFLAWVMHRGYHGLAIPSWERKWRVFWGWWNNFWLGRDIVSISAVQQPREFFEEFAARPKPPAPVEEKPKEKAPAEAAKKSTTKKASTAKKSTAKAESTAKADSTAAAGTTSTGKAKTASSSTAKKSTTTTKKSTSTAKKSTTTKKSSSAAQKADDASSKQNDDSAQEATAQEAANQDAANQDAKSTEAAASN